MRDCAKRERVDAGAVPHDARQAKVADLAEQGAADKSAGWAWAAWHPRMQVVLQGRLVTHDRFPLRMVGCNDIACLAMQGTPPPCTRALGWVHMQARPTSIPWPPSLAYPRRTQRPAARLQPAHVGNVRDAVRGRLAPPQAVLCSALQRAAHTAAGCPMHRFAPQPAVHPSPPWLPSGRRGQFCARAGTSAPRQSPSAAPARPRRSSSPCRCRMAGAGCSVRACALGAASVSASARRLPWPHRPCRAVRATRQPRHSLLLLNNVIMECRSYSLEARQLL